MAFFNSAVTVLQTLGIALGAGLGIWGAINLLEGYGNDNPAAWSVLRLRTLIVLFRADLIRQSLRSSGKGVVDPLHRLKSGSRKTNKRYIHNLSPSEI